MLRARPALVWVVLVAVGLLALSGQGAPTGIGVGYLIAACLYPSDDDATMVY